MGLIAQPYSANLDRIDLDTPLEQRTAIGAAGIGDTITLAQLEALIASAPTTEPVGPNKLWREPPGNYVRMTASSVLVLVGSSIVGSSFIG